MKIRKVTITPIAVPDVPLLNLKGVHQAVFLRSIIEVETESGLVGLGETYGAIRTLTGLRQSADALVGLDVGSPGPEVPAVQELTRHTETAVRSATRTCPRRAGTGRRLRR